MLLGYVQIAVPGLSSQAMLRLDFGPDLNEVDTLATLSIISTGLMYIWQARTDKKVKYQYKMRADLEAAISILRKTRFNASADRMLEIVI